jgi:hypothetical protein
MAYPMRWQGRFDYATDGALKAALAAAAAQIAVYNRESHSLVGLADFPCEERTILVNINAHAAASSYAEVNLILHELAAHAVGGAVRAKFGAEDSPEGDPPEWIRAYGR